MYLKASLFFLLVFSSTVSFGQNIDFTKQSTLGNLFIRMYGEVHYIQPVTSGIADQGEIDAQRIVALFGYQFDRKTQFVTEWELEHADEIFLEQAFIKHRVANNLSIKAGMILIPMGLVNEYHEPNNFYSVDRPLIDRVLVPTTWRDIGIGITGLMPASNLRYQLYLVNGFLSYSDGNALFNSRTNFRSGRQKGSQGIFSGAPGISGQLEYFGFENGKIGISAYSGRSNSTAFDGIDTSDESLVSFADSTTVYTNMIGLHGSFTFDKLTLKSQLIFAVNGNVDEYNAVGNTDLGRSSIGGYAELGYPLDEKDKWFVFGRYSYLDSLLNIGNVNGINQGQNHILTTGINYFAAKGAVFKLDGQWTNLNADSQFIISSGIGVWF